MIRLAAAAAVAVLAVAAGAAQAADPPARPERQCFWTRNVTSFGAADDKAVNVRVGVKDVYRLEMLGRCLDVDWNHQIAIVSRGGGAICSGMDATIVTKGPFGPRRCSVKAVRKLTPEEAAALPGRAMP